MPPPLPSTATNVASSSKNTKPPKGPLANPTAYQLRSLVMDYLCHRCYTRTAVAFGKDSTVRQLDADGDEIPQSKEKSISAGGEILELSKETLREAELRNEIRVKILSGRVDDAIELLNEHFPSVLAPPTPSSSKQNLVSSYPSTLEAMNASKHLIPTTTDSRHLLLNLRILGFTELCRTKPLVYCSPSLRTNEIDMSDPSTSEPLNLDPDGISRADDSMDTDAEADTDMDATTDGEDEELTPPNSASDPTAAEIGDDPHVLKLIQQGQKLYALLDQIGSQVEKELYAQELVNVGALLAYPVPENSPLARYLSMERREAVAEQINKAILVRTGQSPTSKIEVMTRYTTVLWALANEMKIKARPGAILPPTNQAQRTPTPPVPTKQAPDSDVRGDSYHFRPVVPPFNLQNFLELR
ncbi:hypothetical protein P691DRAFT_835004 [Macrolepiota fuliginosa MF-IS2]|uniref:CRA domain-containing protein n=1 Tax=Macrolepiota fuliginosa MF-IS2 TaxID=1400762 RepID=A0A9P5XQB7_9AGAR|nr:hypothetical protein P691DRAFT_835004 [Macrolepiota fuliginosa MF-IS2]